MLMREANFSAASLGMRSGLPVWRRAACKFLTRMVRRIRALLTDSRVAMVASVQQKSYPHVSTLAKRVYIWRYAWRMTARARTGPSLSSLFIHVERKVLHAASVDMRIGYSHSRSRPHQHVHTHTRLLHVNRVATHRTRHSDVTEEQCVMGVVRWLRDT